VRNFFQLSTAVARHFHFTRNKGSCAEND